MRQQITNALVTGLLPQLPAPFTPEVKDSTDLTYFNPEGEHVKQRLTHPTMTYLLLDIVR